MNNCFMFIINVLSQLILKWILIQFYHSSGSQSTPDFILPTTSKVLTEDEESEQLIIDSLKSQKEFEGMNLNQVSCYMEQK